MEERPGSWGLTACVERPSPRTGSTWDAELGSQGQRPVPGGLWSQGWELPESRFQFSMQDLLAVRAASIWMEQPGMIMRSRSLEVCKPGRRPPCGGVVDVHSGSSRCVLNPLPQGPVFCDQPAHVSVCLEKHSQLFQLIKTRSNAGSPSRR